MTVRPSFRQSAFNCPHCGAYAQMLWARLIHSGVRIGSNHWVHLAECMNCLAASVWVAEPDPAGDERPVIGRMVDPASSTAPAPHPDLPEPCLADYDEARAVVDRSPRAAAALLRLVVQKLCKELGKPGENINEDIKALVSDGLPVEIQQALDACRVVGNNSVHPGEMTSDDVAAEAQSLFEAVNLIVDDRIAKPNQMKRLYEKLPQKDRDNIGKRDGTK